jgi:E3 ubiquitin-protein ligase RGLG
MEFYAQNLPQRKFENFKFINFHDIVDASKSKNPESAFAMAALSAIPDQYLKVKQLGYID